ncbi:MAG: hypothetical protein FWD46_02990 [Cystobacterineae bacterium]|nr:hypothetical protein [Cystobacterineae bacterium]
MLAKDVLAKKRRRRGRQQRGQAMLEYGLVAHALLVGGAAIAWPFFTRLMEAFNIYYEGLFFVLTSPIP